MDQIKCEIKGRLLTFECRLTEDQVKSSNMMVSKQICVQSFLATAIKMDIEKILALYAKL